MSQHSIDRWTLAALAAAVAGSVGSVALSVGLGLKACPLCFYQRTFVFSVASVLLIGRLFAPQARPTLPLLAWPLALAGGLVSLFHVSLEVRGALECPAGVLGLGTAPQQALAMFVVLVGLLSVAVLLGSRHKAFSLGAVATAGVLGVVLAAASIKSSPPMPAPPSAPYSQPPDICRPPFRPAG